MRQGCLWFNSNDEYCKRFEHLSLLVRFVLWFHSDSDILFFHNKQWVRIKITTLGMCSCRQIHILLQLSFILINLVFKKKKSETGDNLEWVPLPLSTLKGSRCSFSMMVKWENDGVLQANDGRMLVKVGEMLVNDGEILVDDGEMSICLYIHFTIIN